MGGEATKDQREVPSQPVTRKRTRPKGRRQNASTLDILLVNSSCRPQFTAAMQTCSMQVKAILNQKHQGAGMQFVDLQYDAFNMGWAVHGAQAKCTAKGGRSAGTAIACRKAVGIGDVNGSFDQSPASSPGRLSAAWLQVGPPTGMVVVSVHVCTNEGMMPRNRNLLTHTHTHTHIHAVALASGTGKTLGYILCFGIVGPWVDQVYVKDGRRDRDIVR